MGSNKSRKNYDIIDKFCITRKLKNFVYNLIKQIKNINFIKVGRIDIDIIP